MSRLVRPHIPVEIRAKVIMRQAIECGMDRSAIDLLPQAMKPSRIVRFLLARLFPGEQVHLDHDPALGARKKVYRNGVHVDYSPKANDPRYLIYRTKTEHQLKTNVRGEHGQYPDRVLIKKQRRLERGTKRRKVKIRSANRWPPRGSRKISPYRRS